MEENPFDLMISTLRGTATPAGLVLGKVLSAKPIKLLVGGNTLEKDRLLCNPALLRGYTVPARMEHPIGALEINASCANGAHLGMTVNGGTLETDVIRSEDAWKIGDQLVMLPVEEAQRYIILCQAVEL